MNFLDRIFNRSPRAARLLAVFNIQRPNYHEQMNPLRGLTVERCRGLLEGYLRGEFVDLMWAMGAPMVGVECTDPDLLALIERRTARLIEMDWDIRTLDDSPAARRQAEVLRARYDLIDNLYEAVEHLAMATFRGFSHVEVDPATNRLVPVMQWHMSRDGVRGDWKWNPEASRSGFKSLPEEYRLDERKHWWLVREVRRPVGAWALLKYFYAHLATADWAEFCDIYGIPSGFVVGPPNIPEGREAEYANWAAEAVRSKGGYLPHGSEFTQHAAPAGGPPYAGLLDYLSAKLILAGTGGQLTMLAESGSGTLAGGAHQETFRELAAMEARRISEIFQRQFDRRVLEMEGILKPGGRPLAWFELAHQQETDVGEIVDHAAKLAAAGYRMDPAQIAEKTGYQITEAEAPAEPVGGTTLKNRATGLKNRLGALRGSTPAHAHQNASQAEILELLRRLEEVEKNNTQPGEEMIEDGLRLLDRISADELRGGLVDELERRMMEAVIAGAANAAEKVYNTANADRTESRTGADV